ncbi:DoxX family protein [Brumimicrobium salinarum]|uniref:DoxX family protein n=1 Tax=Brumimicrobium salinarum TaxID=2058658 RepID=A0A2I0R1I5_9FLAO|nr:DoxX family protein [Brumimicrobium salinarum]PKR80426.1 DoxX family protein [Brumimicrobium salinarum]
MKQIVNILFKSGNYASNVNLALLILRVTIGILMLTHGIGKFEKLFLSEGPIQFADPLGIGAVASLVLVVFAEVFCSILLIFGLGTRIASITLFINMIIIAFIVHINDGFGKQEFALLYALPYLTITLIGAGKYSLDYLIAKTKTL